MPDFLIGHPNLFDNARILLKHPNFKPLRAALAAWLIFALIIGSLWGFLTFGTSAAAACPTVCAGQASVRTRLTTDSAGTLRHSARAQFLASGTVTPTNTSGDTTFELKAGNSITIKSAVTIDSAVSTPTAGDMKVDVVFLEDNSTTIISSATSTVSLGAPLSAGTTTQGTDVTFFATSNGLSGGTPKAGTYRIRVVMKYAQNTTDTTNGGYTADSDNNYTKTGTPNTWNAALEEKDQGYLRAGIDLSAISVSQTPGGPTPSPFAWPDSVRAQVTSSASVLVDDQAKGITFKTLNGVTPLRTMTSLVNKSATTTWADNGTGMALDTTDPTSFGVRIGDLEDSALSSRPWTHFESVPAGWTLGTTDGTKSVFASHGSFSYDSTVTLSNVINTDSDTTRVYNRSETAHGTVDIKNARSQSFSPRSSETLTSIDTGGGTENSITFTKSGFTFTGSSVFASSGNVAPATSAGSAKKIRWRDSAPNSPQATDSGQYGLLSSLLIVDNICHARITTCPPKDNQFFIASDNMQVRNHIQDVRGNNKNSATVTCSMIDPDSTTNGTCNGTTGSDGWTGFSKITPQAPSGVWTIRVSASDSNGNASAQTDEPVTFVSPYTAKYAIRTVGWNQEYHKGDTVSFTIQTMTKDASDNWSATNVDSGTTPYYEIQYWDGSAWQSAASRTNMTVSIANSTWTSSYAIPNVDGQIGRKYSVTFNARIGGAQISQVMEFAVVQQKGGDPVTISASPVRAIANDTVKFTVRESNLDATVLTGNATSTKIYIYGPNNTVQSDANGVILTPSQELGNGAYYYSYALGASPSTGIWQALITVTIGTGTYSAATNFEVNYQVAKETTSQTIQTNTTNIETKVDTANTKLDKLIVSNTSVNDTTATTSAFKTNLTNSTNDFYKNGVLVFTSGNDTGQVRRISAYDGSAGVKRITVDPALANAPANGDTFTILAATQPFSEGRVSTLESNISTILTNTQSISGKLDKLIVTNTTVNDPAPSTSSFVTSLTSTTTDFYKNGVLVFTSGTNVGQVRRITAYNGSTKAITVDPALFAAPANGDAFTILAATQPFSEGRVQQLEAKVTGKILNQETAVKSGNSLTIMFKTTSGLTGSSRPVLNVYDATLTQRVTNQTMTEVASTGVYQTAVTFSATWGTGNFTLIASESTTSTQDSLNLLVSSTDLPTIESKVTDVKNKVTDLTNFLVIAQSSVNDANSTATSFIGLLTATTNNIYTENVLVFTSGANTGAVRRISAYDGTTKKLTIDPALPSAPANGDTFIILAQTINEVKNKIADVKVVVDTVNTTASAIKGNTDTILGKVTDILSRVNAFQTPSTAVYNTTQKVDIDQFTSVAQDLKSVLANFKDPSTQDLATILTKIQESLAAIQGIRDDTKRLQEIENAVREVRAVGQVTKQVVLQAAKPIIETFYTSGSIILNLLITNPASSDTTTVEVNQQLPKEVKPGDIISAPEELQATYDPAADSYIMKGKVSISKGSSKKLSIEIKDIWQIPEDELARIEEQGRLYNDQLKGTNVGAQGLVLNNDITLRLAEVRKKQTDARKPEEKIITYRDNRTILGLVKQDIKQMEELITQVGQARGITGQVGGIQTFATWGIIGAVIVGIGMLIFTLFKMWQYQVVFMATQLSGGHPATNSMLPVGSVPFVLRKQDEKEQPARLYPSPMRKKLIMPVFIKNLTASLLAYSGLLFIPVIGIGLFFAYALFNSRSITYEHSQQPASPQGASQEVSPSLQPLSKTLKIGSTPTGWLRVRLEASAKSKEIGRVNTGQTFPWREEKNGWYKIILANGQAGWITGEYVAIISQ